MLRWFPLCLLACSDAGDKSIVASDTSDVEAAMCLETTAEVGLADSIVGFGPVSDLVSVLEVSSSVGGGYADGATTLVFIETRFNDGTIRHVKSEQNPELSAEIDMGCVDRIEADLDSELITSDDQLRVFRTMTGSVEGNGSFAWSAAYSAADNTGTHDPGEGSYNVYVTIVDGQTQGEVSIVTEGGAEGATWIENEVLLTWPLAL
jgi:hypothetical protein